MWLMCLISPTGSIGENRSNSSSRRSSVGSESKGKFETSLLHLYGDEAWWSLNAHLPSFFFFLSFFFLFNLNLKKILTYKNQSLYSLSTTNLLYTFDCSGCYSSLNSQQTHFSFVLRDLIQDFFFPIIYSDFFYPSILFFHWFFCYDNFAMVWTFFPLHLRS